MIENESLASTSTGTVVIDLGKHKRKRVRQLRKGKGALMADVTESLAGLQAEGLVPAGVQPIIVIVREKGAKSGGGLGLKQPRLFR